MTKRQTPPGRKSKLDVVVVKPLGPHHCARCLGSVHAEKTSSRGASNSRTPMIERASVSRSTLFFVAMLVLLFTVLGILGLQLFQIDVEAVETLVEKAAVVFQPFVDAFERLRLDAAGPPLRRAAAGDQAGAFQHLEMLRNRRKAHGEGFCQLRYRGLAQSQARQDGAPGGVGKS